MRISRYLCGVVLLSAVAQPSARLARAADPVLPPPPAAPAAPPTGPAASDPPDPMTKVLPDLNVQSVPIDDVIELLHAAAPGFSAVVVRDSDVPDDFPLVKLRMKNVTLSQVWGVLQTSYPTNLEIQQAPGDGPGVIWIVRVHAGDRNAGHRPAAAGLKLYKLGRAVDAQVGKGGQRKDALNQFLSLIKASLAQVPEKANVPLLLQVHEETETLIFKGSAEQRAVVEQALQVIDPAYAADREEAWRQGFTDAENKGTVKIAELEAQLEGTRRTREQAAEQQATALAEARKEVLKEAEVKVNELKQLLEVAERDRSSAKYQADRLAREVDDLRALVKEQQKENVHQSIEVEKMRLKLEEANGLEALIEKHEALLRGLADKVTPAAPGPDRK